MEAELAKEARVGKCMGNELGEQPESKENAVLVQGRLVNRSRRKRLGGLISGEPTQHVSLQHTLLSSVYIAQHVGVHHLLSPLGAYSTVCQAILSESHLKISSLSMLSQ